TLARPWALPGTPGLEHRIGGLEKADRTGDISYDPNNHDTMVRLRQAKVDRITRAIPPTVVDDPAVEDPAAENPTAGTDGRAAGSARVLVLGWGSTRGVIDAACHRVRRRGVPVAQVHLRHLNPFPPDLGEILRGYDRVILPEMNLGQLAMMLRARYLVDVEGINQVRGMPFRAAELEESIWELLHGSAAERELH
nr:hypothetical protein [Geodermatophilaceae bacterium]